MRSAALKPAPDRQSSLIPGALTRVLRRALTNRDELRYYLLRDLWSSTKRFGSPGIRNIEVGELARLADTVIEGYVDDRNRAVLAALCKSLDVRSFFEIGTNRGRTAWTVARNNLQCDVYTLDLPSRDALSKVALSLNRSDRDFFVNQWDRGEAYAGTPEEERITTLHGDSATFDFSPYEAKLDFVFVDGAHSYDYVRNDTERAMQMLTPTGTVAWDDYPAIPGVYRYLNEIAGTLDAPMYHIYDTRLVVYSRTDLGLGSETGDRARLFAA